MSNVVEQKRSIIDAHIEDANNKLENINMHLNYIESVFDKFLGEIAMKEDKDKSNKTEIPKAQLLARITENLYHTTDRLENICQAIDRII